MGILKLDLLLRGLNPPHDFPEDFILILPENTHVTVTSNPHSPYSLEKKGEGLLLKSREGNLDVQALFPPSASREKTSRGYRVGDLIHVHGGFLAAAPRGPCRFAKSGFACKYCGTKETPRRTDYSNEDFVEAMQILLKETPAEIIHLSSGFVETEDGGIAMIEPLVREIRKHLNILISVDVMPPATNQWIDRTYAAGVDMVYYDLDVFDPTLFAALYPEKDKTIRQKRYLEALEYAVKIFPKGAVTSHLVLGLEPLESTQKGIDALTDLGVVPLITFFPPQPESSLAMRWQPNLKEIIPIFSYLYQRTQEKKLSTNWIRQIDVVLTPLEGRHFVGGKSGLTVAMKNFYHTSIGRKAAFGLSAIRRKLKVREVKG